MRLSYYSGNLAYAARLGSVSLPARYVDAMARPGIVLDVGSGLGSAVDALRVRGCDAYGVDVRYGLCCPDYDLGPRGELPFGYGTCDCVGAHDVLEHADSPAFMLSEMVRVCRPGGWIVISSPNFDRVLPLRGYHPVHCGLLERFASACHLLRDSLGSVRFRPLPSYPLYEGPDDDATVRINGVVVSRYLRERLRCSLEVDTACDRYVSPLLSFVGGLPYVRRCIGNIFVVARKL